MSSQANEQDPSEVQEALIALRNRAQELVEERISRAPRSFGTALPDVLDTFDICHLQTIATTGRPDNNLAIALTTMVLNRQWALEQAINEEG